MQLSLYCVWMQASYLLLPMLAPQDYYSVCWESWLKPCCPLTAVLQAGLAITDYELKFRTNQLEHEFGCPYQLGHHAGANRVEDADLASFHVKKGDIIVMGSDGLLDNLSETDIMTVGWCCLPLCEHCVLHRQNV